MSSKSPQKDLVQEKLVAGSKQCPYKLAIVGGGPSGCSVVIRAFRIGFGDELCGFCVRTPAVDKDGNSILADAQYPFHSGGVCLIDASTVDRFGGGKLQDYVINANTWANKFVTNVMDDKPDVVPPETVSGTPFQKIATFPTAVTLKGFGCKPAPLQMVGAFLRDAGTVVSEVLNSKYPDSSRCLMETTVDKLQQVILPVPAKYIKDKENIHKESQLGCVGWKLTLSQRSPGSPGGKLQREIFAHKVVLATGGRQDLPRLPNPAHTRKLMSSDYICTQKGLDELRSRLVKAGVAANRTTPGRVVVIGGSHSAFSVAWLCLNRLNSTATVDGKTAPTATAAVAAAQESKNGTAGSDDATNLLFCQSGVCMVYKSAIKVFYPTKADADKDGYIVEGPPVSSGSMGNGAAPGSAAKAGSSQLSKSWIRGQIHPFGGLRGDAKELWRAVRDGRETRVKLIQVRQNVSTVPPGGTGLGPNAQPLKQQAIVEKLFDEAVVIVWACGYNTNISFPVLDLQGAPVAMKVKGGQVEVDDQARIISANAHTGAVPVIAEPTMEAALANLAPVAVPASSTAELGEDEAKGCSDGTASGAAHADSSFECSAPSSPVAVAKALGSPKAVPVAATPTKSADSVPAAATASPILAPALLVASPPLAARSSSFTVTSVAPPQPVIEGLLGSGLGYGLQALLETGLPDGSSGRADGVAVYLKRGATLVLAQVLGSRVFGGAGINSWEDRLKIIKKLQLVANAAKSVEGGAASTIGPGVSSSLDAGTSLLGSPSSKRPSTTAGVRNSFSGGVGFAQSPGSTKESNRAGSTVLSRAIASRQNSMEKPPTCGSPKASFSTASTPAKAVNPTIELPFPQFNDNPTGAPSVVVAPTSPARPATASAVSPGSGSNSGALSPKSAINLIKHSPEAQRCAELVEKVATLSAGLEHLQLQGAREFLAVPPSGSAPSPTAHAPLAPAKTVVNVPVTSAQSAASAAPARSASPAAVPRTTSVAVKNADASSGARPPVHARSSSSGRVGPAGAASGSNNLLVPRPTSNARVVLTPLSAELQKKASGTGENGAGLTPRKVRANSGSTASASSSSSTPRSKAPTRPAASGPLQGPPVAVMRSNSLTNSPAVVPKPVAAPSPRMVSNTNSSPVPSGPNRTNASTAVAAPKRAANVNVSAVQGRDVKLELPQIPANKRSQNQHSEEGSGQRARAPSLSKDQDVDLLVKVNSMGAGGPMDSKRSVIV